MRYKAVSKIKGLQAIPPDLEARYVPRGPTKQWQMNSPIRFSIAASTVAMPS